MQFDIRRSWHVPLSIVCRWANSKLHFCKHGVCHLSDVIRNNCPSGLARLTVNTLVPYLLTEHTSTRKRTPLFYFVLTTTYQSDKTLLVVEDTQSQCEHKVGWKLSDRPATFSGVQSTSNILLAPLPRRISVAAKDALFYLRLRRRLILQQLLFYLSFTFTLTVVLHLWSRLQ